jgi:Protein of unknown function (DUF4199)
MKSKNSFTFIFIALSIVTKLLLFYMQIPAENQRKTIVLFHIIFIVASVFFSIKNIEVKNQFLESFKAGSRAAFIYAICISIFVFVYYSYIDVGYFISMQNEIIKTQIVGATPEDIILIKKNIYSFFTIFNYTTITLTGFIVIGVLFSVIISLIKKYTFSANK